MTRDVVVVGGGVVGLACALMLARDGRDVLLLERGELGAGASHGNAGQIRVSECLPLASPQALREVVRTAWRPRAPIRVALPPGGGFSRWARRFAVASRSPMAERAAGLAALGRLSRELLDLLELTGGDSEVGWRAGALDVYETQAGIEVAAGDAGLAGVHGFACEVLGPADARRLEPLLGDVAGAVHFPGDGSLEPAAFVAALTERVRATGVQVMIRRTAQRLLTASGVVEGVVCDGEAIRSRQVVLAGGAHALALLDDDWPIVAGRGYTCDLSTSARLMRPLVLAERHAAATPFADRIRIAGGMVIAARRAATRTAVTARLARSVAEVMPALAHATATAQWTGMRPMTPDGVPIVGRTPRARNLLVAAGHGMLGMTYALGTGQLVAELAGERPTSIDPTCFSPARFDHHRRRKT